MENIIKKLQEEAGLTEEQAFKSIEIIKDYMDDQNIKIDWNKFFKGKYNEFLESTKNLANKVSGKIGETVDDVSKQAKNYARDLSKKVYDKLKDDDE